MVWGRGAPAAFVTPPPNCPKVGPGVSGCRGGVRVIVVVMMVIVVEDDSGVGVKNGMTALTSQPLHQTYL